MPCPWTRSILQLLWLCRSVARQVFDLPLGAINITVCDLFGPKTPDEKHCSPASPRLAAHRSGRAIGPMGQAC